MNNLFGTGEFRKAYYEMTGAANREILHLERFFG